MTRDVSKRLKSLQSRRQGLDRLDQLSLDSIQEVITKSASAESYTRRAPTQRYTQYALGAMQAVDPSYTLISVEEADRVGKQLAAGLAKHDLRVQFRLQGSVPCDIHIRGVSDVDLLVLDDRFFTYDPLGACARRGDYCSPTSYTALSALLALRSHSEQILTDAFPAAKVDISGPKAIHLSGGSLRRPVDVVPSNWHNTADYQMTGKEVDRGVEILNKAVPESVLNMPFRHINLINKRDEVSLGGLKKAIRLCKNVKADALDEGTKIELSSFDIASAMWHADMGALAVGSNQELAILGEATRFLDQLARNVGYAKTLKVPDGSREIFNTKEKIEGLKLLSLEMDDLALQVAREQQLLLEYLAPEPQQIREILRKTNIPA